MFINMHFNEFNFYLKEAYSKSKCNLYLHIINKDKVYS